MLQTNNGGQQSIHQRVIDRKITQGSRCESHTEYVRPEWIPEIRKQIAAYKRLMRLIERWIDLCIERS